MFVIPYVYIWNGLVTGKNGRRREENTTDQPKPILPTNRNFGQIDDGDFTGFDLA